MAKKPVLLMILDGFGLNEKTEGNGVKLANTPIMDKIMKEYPIVEKEIPSNHVIKCPLDISAFILPSERCPGCIYFDGVAARLWADTEEEEKQLDERHPWSSRFMIKCSAPVFREVIPVK